MFQKSYQKVRIIGLKKHYKAFICFCQKAEIIQVIEAQKPVPNSTFPPEKTLDITKISDFIDFLESHCARKHNGTGKKITLSETERRYRFEHFKNIFENIWTEGALAREKSKNISLEILKNSELKIKLEAIPQFSSQILPSYHSEHTKTFIGHISGKQKQNFLEAISQHSNQIDIRVLGENKQKTSLRITIHQSLLEKIEKIMQKFNFEIFTFSEVFSDFYKKTPSEALDMLEKKQQALFLEKRTIELKIEEMSRYLDDFKILHDSEKWETEALELQTKIFVSEYFFAFDSIISDSSREKLKKTLKDDFDDEIILELVNEYVPRRWFQNFWSWFWFRPLGRKGKYLA